MASTVFHEYYGEVTKAQLAAYRKYNVSQSDHDYLVLTYGEDNHEAITKAVKCEIFHSGGSFSTYLHDTRG